MKYRNEKYTTYIVMKSPDMLWKIPSHNLPTVIHNSWQRFAYVRLAPGFRSAFDLNSQILGGVGGTWHRFYEMYKGVTEAQKH